MLGPNTVTLALAQGFDICGKYSGKAVDTGGKNAFIQGLHGDYIVIF